MCHWSLHSCLVATDTCCDPAWYLTQMTAAAGFEEPFSPCLHACRGPGGAATIVPYDICIAADASGGGHLVTSALQELQDRQAAHRHPSAAHHSSSSSAGATGVSELEYRAWHDMPQDPGLAAVLGAAASTTSR